MGKCKDCLHVEVCRDYLICLAKAKGDNININKLIESESIFDGDDCEFFKDRSQFVELPSSCKIGDYIFEPYRDQISFYRINSFIIDRYWNIYANLQHVGGMLSRCGIKITDIGNTVFLTQKEAEQALNKSEENG